MAGCSTIVSCSNPGDILASLRFPIETAIGKRAISNRGLDYRD
jgi:hypothetical protein